MKGETFMNKIDALINEQGDWIISYSYNAYGSNILFLLQNFSMDDIRFKYNQAILEMAYKNQKTNHILMKYIADNPNIPFIINASRFFDCMNILENRLPVSRTIDSYHQYLNKYYEKHEKFLKLCYEIINDETMTLINDVYENGWKHYCE